MADIKTRDVRRGEIRSLDRSSAMTHRMKNVAVRAKENTVSERRSDESSSSSFAIDRTIRGSEEAIHTARGSERVAINAVDRAKREYGKRQTIRRMRGADYEVRRASSIRKTSNSGDTFEYKRYQKTKGRQGLGSISSPRIKTASHTYGQSSAIKRINNAKKIEQARKMRLASKKAAEKTAKGAKRTLQAVVKGIKAAAVAVKTLYAALVAAGSSAVAIIVICTLFASSLYLFGNDTNDEYSAEALGVGDTLIMRVASAQLGNVGGKKFWSWYGFEGRVEWCAIFVSWCGNQCGYIEKGIIPRFAVVGDGVDWFKARKRFQNNTYIPHPGDIIFFDWGADGTRDHVGFVERCDGKTVYTIEGNSGDACKRLAYRVGSPVIIGYGVPAYPLPQSNSKSKSKATGNDLENRPNVRFGIIQTADFNTPVSSSAQG